MKLSKNPVAALCRLLDQRNVNYVFIRDVGSIETVVEEGVGDVDMFCSSNELPAVGAALRDLGWYNLFGGQTYVSPKSDLVFDIYCEHYIRLPMLSREEILGNTQRIRSEILDAELPILQDQFLLVMLLLHPLDLTGIRGQRLYKPDRQGVIYDLWNQQQCREQFLMWSRQRLGSKVSKVVEDHMWNGVLHELPHRVSELRKLLYVENPSYLRFFFHRLILKVRPLPTQRGHIVAVMGVDGSGKSTLITGLRDFVDRYYNEQGRAKVLYMGRQGGFRLPLPRIAGFVSKLRCRSSSSTSPTGKEQLKDDASAEATPLVNGWKGQVWGAVFLLEFAIRFVEIMYWKKMKQKIVITDRYIDDFVHDDNRKTLRKFLRFLFPHPNTCVLLIGDTEIFYKRKGEYNPAILANHQDSLHQHLSVIYRNRLFLVRGDLRPEDALLEAISDL